MSLANLWLRSFFFTSSITTERYSLDQSRLVRFIWIKSVDAAARDTLINTFARIGDRR
ncbi:Conserved hypothetical protein [Prochlorococcus marinus str. MIT 9313]|uniref:Uncharacterized protein n=1 Tax=Prochlorococcus marinus (strain MIT 9313) TaxID=74547 RepID=B9ER56_PROMM|nr:Conserved hypothetical protein [Prochlorococcus marinus str. MIT 9313]